MSIKFINNRIGVGNSSNGKNEQGLTYCGISAAVNVAIDLDMPEYEIVKGKHAGLVCGPGNSLDRFDAAIHIAKLLMKVHDRILIFCHSGLDRSPLVAAVLLSETEEMSFSSAWKQVQEKIPDITFPSDSVKESLIGVAEAWVQQRGHGQRLVSIVMPCFRRPDITERCLKSIRQNTLYKPYEIIGVNDGSTDDKTLVEVLDKYCDTVVNHDENQGVAQCRADGNKAAQGDFVCQIDNDTIMFTNWLTPLVESLERTPNVAIVAPLFTCNMHYFAERVADMSPDNLFDVGDVGTACMLYFKDLMEIIGNFDPDLYNLWEDKDFCYRISKSDLRGSPEMPRHIIAINPSVTVFHEGYVDPKTGVWDAVESNTRSFPELQNRVKIAHSMKLIYERWGVKHAEYDDYIEK